MQDNIQLWKQFSFQNKGAWRIMSKNFQRTPDPKRRIRHGTDPWGRGGEWQDLREVALFARCTNTAGTGKRSLISSSSPQHCLHLSLLQLCRCSITLLPYFQDCFWSRKLFFQDYKCLNKWLGLVSCSYICIPCKCHGRINVKIVHATELGGNL